MTFLWEMYRSNEQHGVCCFPYEREKVPFRTLFPQMITSINFKTQKCQERGIQSSELWILRQMRGELVVRR